LPVCKGAGYNVSVKSIRLVNEGVYLFSVKGERIEAFFCFVPALPEAGGKKYIGGELIEKS